MKDGGWTGPVTEQEVKIQKEKQHQWRPVGKVTVCARATETHAPRRLLPGEISRKRNGSRFLENAYKHRFYRNVSPPHTPKPPLSSSCSLPASLSAKQHRQQPSCCVRALSELLESRPESEANDTQRIIVETVQGKG